LASQYCNITTDLIDIFDRIEEYNVPRRLEQKFELDSGSRYVLSRTGFLEILFEDGVALTNVPSIASVDANSEWFYDSADDRLYVQTSDGTDPDTKTMTSGLDWENHKTRMRNEAMEILDSLLDPRFQRPLPESRNYHITDKYDIDIKRSCALITVASIVSRVAGDAKLAERLMGRVTNTDQTGIIDLHNDRKRLFSWEISPDELGHFNIEAAAANTSAGFLEIKGLYGGAIDESWRIVIDTGGITGTATFKWSRDAGVTFEKTLVLTNDRWTTLGLGLEVRFWDRDGSFILNDFWDIYVITEFNREDAVYPTTRLARA